MHRHPKLAAWHREEDGTYVSEAFGATLSVIWRPEPRPGTTGEPRGFSWKMSQGDHTVVGDGVDEEIETAMLKAEDAAHAAYGATPAAAHG